MLDCSDLERSGRPYKHGGDSGIRTRDLLLAKQALYQLSYVPAFYAERSWCLRCGMADAIFPRIFGSRSPRTPLGRCTDFVSTLTFSEC